MADDLATKVLAAIRDELAKQGKGEYWEGSDLIGITREPVFDGMAVARAAVAAMAKDLSPKLLAPESAAAAKYTLAIWAKDHD